ncbi:MAG TPA: hypothetical protein VL981_04765 [Candidatus Methylacidiphilales bacterium]|nr:hypothetical protein [Candidatus Methylacidiphilales bacterium]
MLWRFLEIEFQKEKEKKKSGAGEWEKLLEEIKELSADRLREHIRKFAERKQNGSPIFPWTVGYRENESYRQIKRWVYADVDIERLYTCGIDPNKVSMKADLIKARGNLNKFAKCYAHKYPEFEPREVPVEKQVIFGIKKEETDKNGTIELLDGAHRTVAMLRNGDTRSKGFTGIIGK